MIPTIVQDNITGTASSIKGVLAEFLTSTLPKSIKELTREPLIKIYWLISGHVEFIVSNL